MGYIKKTKKRGKNSKIVIYSVVFVLIITAVVLIVNFVLKNSETKTNKTDTIVISGNDIPHKNIYENGIDVNKTIGKKVPKSIVNVHVYFDYMCPACSQFEELYNDAFAKFISQNKINLILHPVNMLDRVSQNTRYSSRTASTAYLISQKSPKYFWEFNKSMMSNEIQPEENTTGLTDEEIASVAQKIGVPEDITNQISNHDYMNYVITVSDQIMNNTENFGTPYIKVGLKGEKTQVWENVYEGMTEENYKTQSIKLLEKLIFNITSGKKI